MYVQVREFALSLFSVCASLEWSEHTFNTNLSDFMNETRLNTASKRTFSRPV